MSASFQASGTDPNTLTGSGAKIATGFMEAVVPVTPVADVNGGKLRDSWQVVDNGDGTVTVGNSAEYAMFVNNGHLTRNHTTFVPAVAFVEQALDQMPQVIADILSGKR